MCVLRYMCIHAYVCAIWQTRTYVHVIATLNILGSYVIVSPHTHNNAHRRRYFFWYALDKILNKEFVKWKYKVRLNVVLYTFY